MCNTHRSLETNLATLQSFSNLNLVDFFFRCTEIGTLPRGLSYDISFVSSLRRRQFCATDVTGPRLTKNAKIVEYWRPMAEYRRCLGPWYQGSIGVLACKIGLNAVTRMHYGRRPRADAASTPERIR